MSERFGSKRVLTVGMMMSAVLTLLTPLAIRFHVYLTVVFRTLLGLFSVSSNGHFVSFCFVVVFGPDGYSLKNNPRTPLNPQFVLHQLITTSKMLPKSVS